MEDLLIIGSGPAGLGAALYATRFSLKTSIIGIELGGICNIVPRIDNWLGDPGITGPQMAKKFVDHVKLTKASFIQGEVASIKKEGEHFVVTTENGSYEGLMILLANGMKHRELKIPGEKEYSGNGVHYCFTCDGPLYKDLVVCVVGGGCSAAIAALFLQDYAKKVYLIYRRKELIAEPILVERLNASKKIEIIYETNLTEIYGDKNVKGIKTDSGKDISLDGVFIEAGNIPLTALVKDIGVKLDEKGFIEVDKNMITNVKGVFSAGDVCNASSLKQFITAVATGSIAAQSAYHYLKKK